jgi:hypothetical protein
MPRPIYQNRPPHPPLNKRIILKRMLPAQNRTPIYLSKRVPFGTVSVSPTFAA